MRRMTWVAIVIWASLAAACSPLRPGQNETATVAPTEAMGATSVSVLPTATEAPPTETPRPTVTAIGVSTPTPMPGELQVDWTSTSPDGQWTATALSANLFQGESYYVRVRVEGSAGAQAWMPVSEWRPMGLGFTLPGLLQWSADGTRLYFTNVPHPDGCSLFVNGGDVQSLDLATGQVTELMPEQGLWLALSPNETQVAYIGYGDRGLIIRDLATGQERPIDIPRPVPSATMGAIVWAPDGSALALTASHDPCGIDGVTSVFVVDLATGAVRTLVDSAEQGAVTVRWEPTGQVVVVDRNRVETWLEADTGAAVEPSTAAGGEIVWTTTTPDGEWKAALEQSATGDEEAPDRVRLTLVNDGRTRVWTVVDRAQPAGLGATTPKDVRWSADGTRFYFTHVAAVDGCAWFVNGSGLYSVDLTTGRVSELLPELGLALALSPDEKRVAYVAYGERGLVVRDLSSQAEQTVGLSGGPDALSITQLVWSPDSEQLAVTLVAEACTQLEPGRYLTVVVDADTGEARTLLDNDPRLLTIVEWNAPGRVKLMDWDGGFWWLDVATGAVMAQ